MLGTRESMNALSKRLLGLTFKDTGECTQATLFLDGNPVKVIDIQGTSSVESIEIDGFSYLMEIELEDFDVGIWTCFLYLTYEEKGEIAGHSSVSQRIDYDHYLMINDVTETFDPSKVSQHWDVLVVVRANVKVHVCDLYKPMNRMQAEAQGRISSGGVRQILIEAIEASSAIPINAEGEEIEL